MGDIVTLRENIRIIYHDFLRHKNIILPGGCWNINPDLNAKLVGKQIILNEVWSDNMAKLKTRVNISAFDSEHLATRLSIQKMLINQFVKKHVSNETLVYEDNKNNLCIKMIPKDTLSQKQLSILCDVVSNIDDVFFEPKNVYWLKQLAITL